MDKIYFIVILSVFVIFFIYKINKICNSVGSLKSYIYDTNIEGPTILIIGATHGNEPAGYFAINNLIKDLNNKQIILKNGKLILIPAVNYCALKLGIRFIPFIGDLNRKYPSDLNDNKSCCPITQEIINLANEADFVLDFHEGWGFNRLNKKSMGSTISPTNTQKSFDISKILLNSVNTTIDDNNKKFMILANKDLILANKSDKSDKSANIDYSDSINIKGTLRYYQQILNKDYILIETTGQNNIQPLDVRIKQNNIFIYKILEFYNII